MIAELGHFALILALCLALTQACLPLLGTKTGYLPWIRLSRPVALGQSLFIFMSFACLMYAFVSNDFSVAYVAENSNTHLPLGYRIAALWGAHEGSLLLWVTTLSCWTVAVVFFSKGLPEETLAKVLAILALISIGFLLFLLTNSNPFLRFLPNFPQDGQDLNPLLQDPGLAIHPPILYMGYVGFAVPFAFVIAALLSGKLDVAWARWSRPWTIVAWCFLTLGIVLGSWWAYRVLGWGGWWFWDPVENASFLPWLVGTALIHCLIVTEKRGAFKSWTALLAIAAFSLSLLGTFLVRSGILVSVHAFAIAPSRGEFMLKFLFVVVAGSLALYAWRAHKIRSEAYFSIISRESFLLMNTLLLFVVMMTVLLGTIYPLIIEALGFGKLSVGAPYFNTVFIPLIIVFLFVMGFGPNCNWQHMSLTQLLLRMAIIFLFCASLGLVIPRLLGGWPNIWVFLATTAAFWIILSSLNSLWARVKNSHSKWDALKKITRSQFAMVIAHIGVAICVIGVTFTSVYSKERDVEISKGEQIALGSYQFQFSKIGPVTGPNWQGLQASFLVSKDGKFISTLDPQKRIYLVSNFPMSKAAIDAGIFRDLYVALGDQLGEERWSVRFYYKPFIRWIWGGGILIMLGGLLALTDERYRRKVEVASS